MRRGAQRTSIHAALAATFRSQREGEMDRRTPRIGATSAACQPMLSTESQSIWRATAKSGAPEAAATHGGGDGKMRSSHGHGSGGGGSFRFFLGAALLVGGSGGGSGSGGTGDLDGHAQVQIFVEIGPISVVKAVTQRCCGGGIARARSLG